MTTAADYNDVHIQGGWKCVENVILTALPPVVTRHVQLYSDHSVWFRINQSRSKGVCMYFNLINFWNQPAGYCFIRFKMLFRQSFLNPIDESLFTKHVLSMK